MEHVNRRCNDGDSDAEVHHYGVLIIICLQDI